MWKADGELTHHPVYICEQNTDHDVDSYDISYACEKADHELAHHPVYLC